MQASRSCWFELVDPVPASGVVFDSTDWFLNLYWVFMKRVSCRCPVIKVSAARSNPSKFQWSSRQSFSGCNRGKLQFLQKRQKLVCCLGGPVVSVADSWGHIQSITHTHLHSSLQLCEYAIYQYVIFSSHFHVLTTDTVLYFHNGPPGV